MGFISLASGQLRVVNKVVMIVAVAVISLATVSTSTSASSPSGRQDSSLIDAVVPFLADIIAGSNATIPASIDVDTWARCRSASEAYGRHLTEGAGYAVQMLDATSKLPDGLFNGNFFSPGNWDECLDVRLPAADGDGDGDGGKGQYCIVSVVKMQSENNGSSGAILLGDFLIPGVSVFVGTCIPSQCPAELFESSLQLVLETQGLYAWVNRCVVENRFDEPWTKSEIFGVAFFSFFTLVVATGTAVDVLNRRFDAKIDVKRNLGLKMLNCFSIYTNTEKLILVDRSNPNEMGCLHGMRFITISWIIMGHVYSEPPMYNSSINQAQNIGDWFKPGMMLILNSTMSVDTFFTISGFLVSYGLLKTLAKTKGKFPVVKFYVHRFLRLTPIYAAVVVGSATVMPLVGDGPLYKQFWDIMGKPCLDEWWRALLYVANLWDKTWTCVAHAWYMSNDMQFYVVSPLFILPLFYKPVLGYLWLFLGLVASIVAPLYVMYSRNVWGSLVGQHLDGLHNEQFAENFPVYYIKPWCRIGPYLVGIFLGFLFYRIELQNGGKRKKSTLPTWGVWAGWILSTVTCLLAIFGIGNYFKFGGDYMPLSINAWYTVLHRMGWSMAISWIIYACVFGRGGIANTFLSWGPFVPLGRLTYAAYLAHLYSIGWFKGTRKAGEHLDLSMQVFTFFGYHFFGHSVGYLLSMTFEVPFLRLEKILMPWNKQKNQKKPTVGNAGDGKDAS